MLELYQFPISHFCEKARWALDYKELPHKKHNLIPGLHLAVTKRHCSSTSVPILKHGHRFIQNSQNIVSYLDEQFANNPLTPSNPNDEKQAIEWETFVDKEVGPHIRRIVYHTLLQHPDIVVPFFTHEGPWYGKLYLKVTYGGLTKLMRKGMNINETKAAESEDRLVKAITTIEKETANKEFIVGGEFSRADLATAALLAPFAMPAGYGLDWPQTLPEPLNGLVQELAPKLSWVNKIYAKYR